jgi:hypothetical protein
MQRLGRSFLNVGAFAVLIWRSPEQISGHLGSIHEMSGASASFLSMLVPRDAKTATLMNPMPDLGKPEVPG